MNPYNIQKPEIGFELIYIDTYLGASTSEGGNETIMWKVIKN